MSDVNPVLIAIIAVAICFFLLSGLRKPARAAADSNNNSGGAARGGARAAAGGKPMVSVSGGCVVRFGAGGPHVPPEAAQALRSLAERHDGAPQIVVNSGTSSHEQLLMP